MKKLFASTIMAVGIFAPFAADAEVPSSAESGRLEQQFTKQKLAPKIDQKELIKDEESDLPAAKAQAVKFILSSLNVSGNTVISDEELAPIYNDKLGKEISLAELYGIRDEITKLYRQKGYILSRAVIPAQDFSKKGAKVEIKIIEGYVNSVTKQGSARGSESRINYYIEQIKQTGPLNSSNLEKYLLFMNDLPGVNATATLTPAKSGTGGADVVINLDSDRFEGLISVDNSGSKFVGRELFSGQLTFNSLLGLDEEVELRGLTASDTHELRFGSASYQMPIGNEGTTAKIELARVATQPGSTLESLDIEGDTMSYRFQIDQSILRSRRENFSLRGAFEVKNTNTTQLNLELYEDRTRVLSVGGTYDLADRWGGINVVDLSLNQGIDVFNADKPTPHSRTNGDTVFTKINVEANRLQNIGGGFALFMAASGQYSFDPLYASEEFGVGGAEFGRGYDFSEITGENGFAGKVELQYGDQLGYSWLDAYQLYGFYDFGKVWQRDVLATESDHDSLTSTGIGTRLNFVEDLSGFVEVAKPLTRPVSSDKDEDLQFNFGLAYIF